MLSSVMVFHYGTLATKICLDPQLYYYLSAFMLALFPHSTYTLVVKNSCISLSLLVKYVVVCIHNGFTILAVIHISFDHYLTGVGFVNFQTGLVDPSMDVTRAKSARSS